MNYIRKTDAPKVGVSDTRLKKLIKDGLVRACEINGHEVVSIEEVL